MSKIWLASLMLCGAAAVGCQSTGKSHDCHCSGDVAQKETKKDDSKEEVITADKVPAAVMNSFKKEFPGATVEKIEKESYADGTVHYEFEFKGKDGKEQEVELNGDGEVLEDH